MRILVLANIDMGLYKFRKELLEALVRKHDVFFCVPNGDYVEKIQILGCKYVPCLELERRSTNITKDLKLIRFYSRVISQIKPDLVLTYTIKPNVYGGLVCRMKRIPYIVNVTGLGTSIENGGVLAHIALYLYKIGLKKARCVFFQNKQNEAFFKEKRIAVSRTRCIPGSGVNITEFKYEPYPAEQDDIKFLFVGRIMKDKGISELLQAIRYIHDKNKNVHLEVVGFCEESFEDALNEAEFEGYAIYSGTQNDVRPFYQKCNCVVLPSYHEGMSNVLLEASSCGRPIITTDVPGCKEVLEEGKTGLVCKARDVESLIIAMDTFLNITHEQRLDMGVMARKKIEAEFDRKLIIEAYLDEIEKLH